MPPGYDSLLAKLIVSGRDRAEALARLRRALARCEINGVATTIPMHAALLAQAEFARGGVDTGYLGRFLDRQAQPPGGDPRDPHDPLVRSGRSGG